MEININAVLFLCLHKCRTAELTEQMQGMANLNQHQRKCMLFILFIDTLCFITLIKILPHTSDGCIFVLNNLILQVFFLRKNSHNFKLIHKDATLSFFLLLYVAFVRFLLNQQRLLGISHKQRPCSVKGSAPNFGPKSHLFLIHPK